MDIKGIGAFILIIIFTFSNLAILHKFVFRIYFSGTAIFREIFYSFLLAFVEAGFVVKFFSGVLGVVLAIIKFILKLALILAIIAVIGFVLSKILPKIIPQIKPVIAKILSFINEKIHIFNVKPNEADDRDVGVKNVSNEEQQ